MVPEIGIYPGIPFEEYQSWDAVNNSTLWTLKTHSPLHAKTYLENPPEPTQAFRIGRAFHTLILEPRKFNKFYAVMPICDKRTKEGKQIYKAFQDSCDGQEILSKDEFNNIDVMADSVKKQVIYRFVQQGEAEVCIVWQDKKTGLICKARIDYVHRQRGILIDVKTTTDASALVFAKSIYNYGYYQQCAFYSDGWAALTEEPSSFVFLPIEKQMPYEAAAYEMAEQVIFAGRQSYREALDKYAECLKTNKWPGYSDTVEMLNLPTWALYREGISEHQIFE